jgi:uncharacterized protein (TIGR02284 family)
MNSDFSSARWLFVLQREFSRAINPFLAGFRNSAVGNSPRPAAGFLPREEIRTRAAAAEYDYICMKEQKETVSVLDELIETLKDGQEGFKQAAEAVKDPQLKSLFSEYSQQRSRFASALQNEVRSLGETEPETTSSTAGALHRGWINLKSAVTGGDDHAILAECERGEDSAVEEYKKALQDDLSPSVYEIVSRQYAEIKAAHDRIRNLRDSRS